MSRVALLGLDGAAIGDEKRQLIGAYFCHEYSYAAAALMNPSAVPHFDQSGMPPGSQRILMSLRAVGEGHISSVAFREGIITANWPDILRSAATMVAGVMPPSQLLRKFAAYPRQHALAEALKEIGRVERTLFIIEWALDADMQRRAFGGRGHAGHQGGGPVARHAVDSWRELRREQGRDPQGLR